MDRRQRGQLCGRQLPNSVNCLTLSTGLCQLLPTVLIGTIWCQYIAQIFHTYSYFGRQWFPHPRRFSLRIITPKMAELSLMSVPPTTTSNWNRYIHVYVGHSTTRCKLWPRRWTTSPRWGCQIVTIPPPPLRCIHHPTYTRREMIRSQGPRKQHAKAAKSCTKVVGDHRARILRHRCQTIRRLQWSRSSPTLMDWIGRWDMVILQFMFLLEVRPIPYCYPSYLGLGWIHEGKEEMNDVYPQWRRCKMRAKMEEEDLCKKVDHFSFLRIGKCILNGTRSRLSYTWLYVDPLSTSKVSVVKLFIALVQYQLHRMFHTNTHNYENHLFVYTLPILQLYCPATFDAINTYRVWNTV